MSPFRPQVESQSFESILAEARKALKEKAAQVFSSEKSVGLKVFQ